MSKTQENSKTLSELTMTLEPDSGASGSTSVALDLVEAAESAKVDKALLSRASLKKNAKIDDLERRLTRLEKRAKTNERFARTFANCLTTQVVAVDAVTEALRHALRNDADIHEELAFAIKAYDKRKFQRWFSGFFGAILWLASIMVAAVTGAFIYWVFSGM